MSAIRSKENRTETALRKTLHQMGFRYRKHYSSLPGKPDIVFPREKVAVFVDGDFWHGRLLLERGQAALEERFKKNRDYWVPKIRRNVERDNEVTEKLVRAGWKVMRFWESDIRRDVSSAAREVAERVLEQRRQADGE